MKAKVLALHNYYQQPGGEDSVFATETQLLEANGHDVVRLTVHNDDLAERSRLSMGAEAIWSSRQYDNVSEVIRTERPDVVHCHNTFPQLSPAVYYAAHRLGVPVVQTLHNFRLTCVNGNLFRDGKPCTRCVGRHAPWEGVKRACYRENRAASLTVAAMVAVHKVAGTYRNLVDRYIATTEFARAQFIRAGLPADRVVVKPNLAHDRSCPTSREQRRDGFLYVGRLSEEKGILLLLEAARRMRSGATVTIVGDGPLRHAVEAAVATDTRLCYEGPLAPAEVHARMLRARALVIPSLCFENFPVVAAEAFSAGTPVVASAHGGLTSIVSDGATGRLVTPGDADAFASALDALESTAEASMRMGRAARARYEAALSPAANYAQLVQVYAEARARRAA